MALDVDGILRTIGVDVLRESGDELLGRCPMHMARTGKPDLHPSWSINTKTLVHHCFSCGYSGTLGSLYRDMGENPPDDLEWELKKQSLVTSAERLKAESEQNRRADGTADLGPVINEWQLDHYVDLPDKLLERRMLKRSAVDAHKIRWDKERKVWVIPIRTPKGDLMGFQYRQKGIVLNHPEGMQKSTTLFGLHMYTGVDSTLRLITIVESPLDVVRLHGVGIPAVSSFGASVSADQMTLLSRYFSGVVLAMDNDPAGRQANQALAKVLKRLGRNVFPFSYKGLGVKDPGDVKSDEELVTAWKRSTHLNLTRENIL